MEEPLDFDAGEAKRNNAAMVIQLGYCGYRQKLLFHFLKEAALNWEGILL